MDAHNLGKRGTSGETGHPCLVDHRTGEQTFVLTVDATLMACVFLKGLPWTFPREVYSKYPKDRSDNDG